MNRSIQY
jgi:hypothetical protein